MLTSDERDKLAKIEEQARVGYGVIGGLQDARPWLCALVRRLDGEHYELQSQLNEAREEAESWRRSYASYVDAAVNSFTVSQKPKEAQK